MQARRQRSFAGSPEARCLWRAPGHVGVCVQVSFPVALTHEPFCMQARRQRSFAGSPEAWTRYEASFLKWNIGENCNTLYHTIPAPKTKANSLPWNQRGAFVEVDFSGFRGNTRQEWRSRDVEYEFCFPRPGLLFAIAPRKIQGCTMPGHTWEVQNATFCFAGVHSSPIGCTSCIVKSFRSRRFFISSPLWTP